MGGKAAAGLKPGQREGLRELLSQDHSQLVPLPIVVALEELAISLGEVGSGMSLSPKGDRGSLIQDVDTALIRAGDALAAVTSPTLHSFRKDCLPTLGAAWKDPGAATEIAEQAKSLIDQLLTPAGVEAAWDDLIDALRDPPGVTKLELAAAQLRTLISMRGHDWVWKPKELMDLVSQDDLEGARKAAAADAPSDVAVVWVAFGNAQLDVPVRRVGQIQFFSDQLPLASIRDGCPALDGQGVELARELDDHAIEFYFGQMPVEPCVLVRVELCGPRARQPTSGRPMPPVEWARDLAAATVETAAFRRGESDWILLAGGCYFTVSGNNGGTAGFDDPRHLDEVQNFRPPAQDPTDETLASLPDPFVDALAEGEPGALDAVSTVRWYRAVREAKEQSLRLVNFVRTFEESWAGTGLSWEEGTRRNLRDFWCRDMQDRSLMLAGHQIESASRHGVPGLEEAASAVYEQTGGLTFRIHLTAVGKYAGAAAESFPAGSLRRLQLRELARATSSGAQVQSWWTSLRADFDVLLNRAVRQRNRIVHGRRQLVAVVATCEPFIARISSYLVAERIEAAARHKSLQEVFEEERERLEELFDKIGGGSLGDFYE